MRANAKAVLIRLERGRRPRKTAGAGPRRCPTEKPSGRRSRLLAFDWDAIAGIVAAVLAIVLHLLHVVEEDVLLSIALVLLALLFVRDLRTERSDERLASLIEATAIRTRDIEQRLQPIDAVLVGPRDLRNATERFSHEASGEMVWFHVCLSMFRPQQLFDAMLRPAIENPNVTSIQFVLDRREQESWAADVIPKVSACRGAAKVLEPHWTEIDESVSVIFSGGNNGRPGDALLSFWGEPFMSHSTARPVPRYIFRVAAHSELAGRLADVERSYRFSS